MALDQRTVDQQHVRTLSILHYVEGGLLLFMSLGGLAFVGFGIFFAYYVAGQVSQVKPAPGSPGPPPGEALVMVGRMYMGIGVVLTLYNWVQAAFAFVGARCLAKHRRRTLCFVAAGVNCLFVPLGTILGIFTILVLLRPTVMEMFDAAENEGPALPEPRPAV